MPTLQQQPQSTLPQQTNEPARAPGSKADGGSAMPMATPNSGTTETFAADPADAAVQWPCAQRKVPTISAGTLWSGPSLDEGKDWDQDNDVAALAQKLASRRLPIDQVDPLVADFAKGAGKDKDKKLTELFVGVLDVINTNRTEVLEGIMRYARGQERLAARMRKEADAISEKMSDVQGPDRHRRHRAEPRLRLGPAHLQGAAPGPDLRLRDADPLRAPRLRGVAAHPGAALGRSSLRSGRGRGQTFRDED